MVGIYSSISEEDRYARHNPEGGDITDIEDTGVWDNVAKVNELKEQLIHALEAGNFDEVHRIVDELSHYHN